MCTDVRSIDFLVWRFLRHATTAMGLRQARLYLYQRTNFSAKSFDHRLAAFLFYLHVTVLTILLHRHAVPTNEVRTEMQQ